MTNCGKVGYQVNQNGTERRLVRIGYYALTGKILGKGHFARVEEAEHTLLNQQKVAIKIINIQDIKDEYILKNLKREARILSKISHPNIVFLFESILTSRRYYLVTELVSGGDLCRFIKSEIRGKIDEKRARPLARQLVSAVGHLHELGIVHRDLKMENILLDEKKENLKIVDFGLSNFCKFDQLLNTHCGSPEYAAPELYISGRKYGPEVDIWSLGVICYAMLVGRLPFESWYVPGLTPEEKRKHLIRETKKGLTYRHEKRLMDLSCLFRSLIVKMLCPKPEDRISIQELQMHSWVYGHCQRKYPVLEIEWHKEAFQKLAKILQMPVTEICHKIKAAPYGYVGGLYNIKKFTEHSQRVKLSCPKINYKHLENEIASASDIIEAINRSNKANFQARPVTTAGSKANNIPIHEKKKTVDQKEIVEKAVTNLNNKTIKRRTLIEYFNDKFSSAFTKPIQKPNEKDLIPKASIPTRRSSKQLAAMKPNAGQYKDMPIKLPKNSNNCVLQKKLSNVNGSVAHTCQGSKPISVQKTSILQCKTSGSRSGIPLHTAARAIRRQESKYAG